MTPHETPACLSYEHDTDRVAGEAEVGPEMREAAAARAGRYLDLAERLLAGGGETLHLALDPGLSGSEGRAARRLALAAEAPGLGAWMAERTGRPVRRLDAVVIMGPEFVGWDDDERRLREAVASDIGWLVGKLYPIRAEGHIEALVPWLLQVASEVTAYGAADPEAAPGRVERSVGRAFNAAARAHYDSWNAHGQLLTDHPAWPYLADEVAKEALHAAATLHGPVSLESLARMAHAAIGRALASLGVKVVAVSGEA